MTRYENQHKLLIPPSRYERNHRIYLMENYAKSNTSWLRLIVSTWKNQRKKTTCQHCQDEWISITHHTTPWPQHKKSTSSKYCMNTGKNKRNSLCSTPRTNLDKNSGEWNKQIGIRMNTIRDASRFRQVYGQPEVNRTLEFNTNLKSQQYVYWLTHVEEIKKSWKNEKSIHQLK